MTALLQDAIRRQASVRAEAPAVVFRDSRLSYGELETQSSKVARQLREAGCKRGDRVGLLLPKSPDAIVAIIGTLKAECTYVPLDPRSPPARLKRMLQSCGPRCIIATDATCELLATVAPGLDPEVTLGWLGSSAPPSTAHPIFTATDIESMPAEAPENRCTSHDPAYILFTSGSTGVPKGVVITHENVAHFLSWAVDYFDIGADDRISNHPPLHFDLSVFDIFGAFAAGAALYPTPPELNLLSHKLVQFIESSQLTQWFSVPAVYSMCARDGALDGISLPCLRRALWCGEVLSTPSLRYWMKHVPHAAFTNLYGPTEATIASSYFTVPQCPADDGNQIPIGNPCAGEELLVLDEDLREAPVDTVADLYIAGVGLSPGYWQERELTATAFLECPGNGRRKRIYKTGDLARYGPDGLLYFHGRRDTQVKSRGYRIELGEVEAAVHAVTYISEAAVVAVPTDGFDGIKICCAYTYGDDG